MSSAVVHVPTIRSRWLNFLICSISEREKRFTTNLLDAYKEWKVSGRSRTEFLERAAQIEGIYVPSFYEAEYHEDGTLKSFHSDKCPRTCSRQETDCNGCDERTLSAEAGRTVY